MGKYETRLFINGEPAEALSGKSFPLKNPTTNEFIADIPTAGESDVENAVIAAERAQPAWAATPAYIRARILRKFADLMHENSALLQELDSVCMGKPVTAAAGDIEEGRNITNYFSGLVELADGQTALNTPEYLNMTIREPYGVVAGIVPWNFPSMIWVHEVVPACGAGNAMILKTSEKSPLSGILLAKLCTEAGFPPGIINVISGAGDTGQLLSSHMRIRKISFTGSTRAGRAVMQAAARSNVKDVTLEMGGKSPIVVFADANLAKAAALTIQSFTTNSGQVCTASTRAYVQKGAAKEFQQLLAAGIKKLVMGTPSKETTDLGPQADSAQAAAVARYLDIGNEEGHALIGGKKAIEFGENFIHPTVFTNIADTSKISVEEVFGPVLVLHEFETEEEVIRRANDTEYGLYASVFSTNINVALRVARRLQAGNVGVNTTSPYGAYELPFGGFKGSGIGKQKGSNAVLSWTQEKSVYIRHDD